MKRSKTVAGVICALVLGASLFAGIVPAFAEEDETSRAGSQIDMTYKAKRGKFVGQVTSRRDACLGDRTVKLFKARNDALVGKTSTNDNGGWSIGGIRKGSGKYYSKVIGSEIVLDTGQDEYGNVWTHLLVCGAATSGDVAAR